MINQQKKGIFKIQEHNFDSKKEYNQFLSNSSQQILANQKELVQAKGLSNAVSLQNLKPNKPIKISNFSQSDEFKRIVLKNFIMKFKDEILEQTNDIQQQTNDTQQDTKQQNKLFKKNHNINQDKKNKNFNIRHNVNCYNENQIKKNQSKQTIENKKNISQYQQLQMKQIETQTIEQQEEIEKNIKKEKDQANKNKEMKNQESQRFLFEKQQLIQKLQNFQKNIEALQQEKLQNNNYYNLLIEQTFKKKQVLENQITKINSNINSLDQDYNNRKKQYQEMQHKNEQIKKALINKQNKNQYKTKSEIVNRKQNFISNNQSQITIQQSSSQLQDLEQENYKITQFMENFEQEYLKKKDQYQNKINQLNSILQNYNKDIEKYKLEFQQKESKSEQQLKKKRGEEQQFTQYLFQLNKLQQENQEKFELEYQNIQDKIQELENQNADLNNILNQLTQQKQTYNQFQDVVLYPIKNEYQQEMALLQDLPQIQQFDSLNQVETQFYLDEIFDQEQRIMILQYQSIRYLKDNNWVKITYTPKWQNKDEKAKKNNLQLPDLEQKVLIPELTEYQVNAYAEYLQNRDEKYYFMQPSNIRQKYRRLYIFPTYFIEQFKLNYSQNKEVALGLILNQLAEYEAIQYQFWLIYKRIAFIIKQQNQHYYIITVDINNKLIIVYDSMPQVENHYNQILFCINDLFSSLLKEQNNFNIHISPTFPITNSKKKTSCYACVGLEYYSRNIVNKEYQSCESIISYFQNQTQK